MQICITCSIFLISFGHQYPFSHLVLIPYLTNNLIKFVTSCTFQASFRLSWGCNGDKSGQQKHEVVSFERGDITTAERSSKQVT